MAKLLPLLVDILLWLLLALLCGVVLMGGLTLLHHAGMSPWGWDALPDTLVFLLSVVAMAGPLLLFERIRPLPALSTQAYSAQRALTLGVLLGLGVAMAVLAAQWALQWLGVPVTPANDPLVRSLLREGAVMVLATIVLAGPVVEEAMFRRRVYGRLVQAGWPRAGFVISSALFAFMHEFLPDAGQSWLAWGSILFIYFCMACVFAWGYQRTGRLLTPIAAHAASNLVMCLLAWFGMG